MAPRTLVRPDVAASPPTSSAYALVVRIAGLAPLMGVGSTQFAVSNPTWLTNAQLRASALPVVFPSSQQIVVGEVEVKNDVGNPIPISHASLDITLSALRNALTAGATLDSIVAALASVYTRLADGSQVVVGPLTNTQLRATPVPVTSTGVKLSAGAATIGVVDQGAAGAASWPVKSTSVKLAAGAATIGKVDQGAAGAASWPFTSTSVKLAAGAAAIGTVAQGAAGAASWPFTSTSVKLAAGAATVGKVDQGVAGAAAWPVKSTAVVVTNTTRSLSAATLAALESISVQNTTAAAVPTVEQNTLVPKKFDYIGLTYSTFAGSTSKKLTGAAYKTGGSGGTLQATLTLAYSTLLQLASVTRT